VGDDAVEDKVSHCPKVTTPEAVEGFANLPPARLSAHPVVLTVTATESSVVMEIDVVSCLRSAPAEGSVLPAANAHDTNSFQRPAFREIGWLFFIWLVRVLVLLVLIVLLATLL
jgi:hypothetical protein